MTRELKKITWISNKEALRKSLMVIGICAMFAALLYLTDSAVLLALGKIVSL